LERSRSARQAVDLVGDLIRRHGQTGPVNPEGRGSDSALLIADSREAFALEAAGHFWVCQEVREVRAQSDGCTVRQDWDSIAPGLSAWAIEDGWWPANGSKLDFAGAVAPDLNGPGAPLLRWGRATLLLEMQNGHLDIPFVRRLLGDHYEDCADEVDPLLGGELSPLCLHPFLAAAPQALPACGHQSAAYLPGEYTASSLVVHLQSDSRSPLVAWCCPGPPCTGVYLPVFLEADLPEALGPCGRPSGGSRVHAQMWQLLGHVSSARELWILARETFAHLQARFDWETEEFLAETDSDAMRRSLGEWQRRAGLFMDHVLEKFDEAIDGLLAERSAARELAPARQRWVVAADER
jgi:dipeptidase